MLWHGHLKQNRHCTQSEIASCLLAGRTAREVAFFRTDPLNEAECIGLLSPIETPPLGWKSKPKQ
jgi:hypothetical protein